MQLMPHSPLSPVLFLQTLHLTVFDEIIIISPLGTNFRLPVQQFYRNVLFCVKPYSPNKIHICFSYAYQNVSSARIYLILIISCHFQLYHLFPDSQPTSLRFACIFRICDIILVKHWVIKHRRGNALRCFPSPLTIPLLCAKIIPYRKAMTRNSR